MILIKRLKIMVRWGQGVRNTPDTRTSRYNIGTKIQHYFDLISKLSRGEGEMGGAEANHALDPTGTAALRWAAA